MQSNKSYRQRRGDLMPTKRPGPSFPRFSLEDYKNNPALIKKVYDTLLESFEALLLEFDQEDVKRTFYSCFISVRLVSPKPAKVGGWAGRSIPFTTDSL